VPEPGFPSNSALTRPFVGQAQFGDGSEGGGGVVRLAVGAGRAGALVDAAPCGGVSRITWPG